MVFRNYESVLTIKDESLIDPVTKPSHLHHSTHALSTLEADDFGNKSLLIVYLNADCNCVGVQERSGEVFLLFGRKSIKIAGRFTTEV